VAGSLESINIAAHAHGRAQPQEEAVLVAGKGIVGDRYFRETGADPAAEVTLIEREQVERFRAATGLATTAAETGRNLETSGIDVNALVGRRFRIGEVVLEGLELCEPCATLGKALATPERTPAEIVKAFAHCAGLRARIVSGGTVRRGDRVNVDTQR
jgi:MOSC domain-containing protein YiiM